MPYVEIANVIFVSRSVLLESFKPVLLFLNVEKVWYLSCFSLFSILQG